MKMLLLAGAALALFTLSASAADKKITMTVETAKGKIVIQLNGDGVPVTIKNLRSKADAGFYNGLAFHRVEDWVIQGGDPTGTGSGGEKIRSEYNQAVFKRGSVGIARGPDRNLNSDCQWFVCKRDSEFLTGDYTNVGTVTEGMDVVDKIAKDDKMTKVTIAEADPAKEDKKDEKKPAEKKPEEKKADEKPAVDKK